MSLVSKRLKTVARTAVLLLIVLSSPTPTRGQFQQLTTYVCQTPQFWCAFQYPAGYPDGTACYCNTMWGPIGGRSINPTGVPNAPELPAPQAPQNPTTPRPPSGKPGTVDPDDCYKGLGNCPGSFMRAAREGGQPAERDSPSDPPPGESSTSPFAAALQQIIDAAEDGFDDVRGAPSSGTSASDTYESTVVPAGMRRCTVFVPRGDRRPFLTCFPPRGTTASSLVRKVASALGSDGERDDNSQRWRVGDVEVVVDRDSSSPTIRVRSPRD